MTPYPQRITAHRLEGLSERHFRNCLPENWMSSKPEHDYGVDLRVEMPEGDSVTGLELLVQLKASATTAARDYETVELRTSTYNYLRNKLEVVMLVKYVADRDEAYWLLLSEVPAPNRNYQSFTIRISKNRPLATINWQRVQSYVRQIADLKLSARRMDDFRYQHELE